MSKIGKYFRGIKLEKWSNFLRVLGLGALPFLAFWLLAAQDARPQDFRAEKINLALRRTADQLLRLSGDSISRIAAIEQTSQGAWRVRIEHQFDYDKLPALLQASLDLHGIKEEYNVVIRSCKGDTINLGYNKLDFTKQQSVACGGRELPDGCHYIEVTFLGGTSKRSFWVGMTGIFLLLAGVLLGYWISRRRKAEVHVAEKAEVGVEGTPPEWLCFGNCKLDVSGQILMAGTVKETLTFRETKLLQLFANNVDRLLDRESIIQQVWADEGVLVGRSVDVFVSRLRKKIAADPTIAISVVHGVGYRLETSKHS